MNNYAKLHSRSSTITSVETKNNFKHFQNFLLPIIMNKMESLLSTDLSTRIDGKKEKKSSYSHSFNAPYERKIIFILSRIFHDTIIIIVEPNRFFRPSFRYESMNKKRKEREKGKENSKYISRLVRGLYETPFQRKNMVLDQEICPKFNPPLRIITRN